MFANDIFEFLDVENGGLDTIKGFIFLFAIVSFLGLLIGVFSAVRDIVILMDYSLFSRFKKINALNLFKSKINEDINNATTLSSVEEIKKNISVAIEKSEKVKKLSEDERVKKWMNNNIINVIDNGIFTNSTFRYIIDGYSSQKSQLEKKYNETKKEIEDFDKTSLGSKKIEFHVALVQPAFFVTMKQVIEDAKIEDYCEAKSDTQTGPETIKRCIELYDNTQQKSIFYSFVAPQFAYTTLEVYKDKKTNNLVKPGDFFVPIINLTNERQEVLFLEGKNSLPRENKLFYLNNSTAEEYAVEKFVSIDSIFSPEKIDDFSEYKMLLKGEKIRGDLYMREGDGIVLWEPLTTFYLNKRIRNSHLKKPKTSDPDVFQNYSDSKIMLFVESALDSENHNFAKFYNLIMKAFILKVHLRQQMQFSSNSTNIELNEEFNLEARKTYQDGHEGFFKQLFS